uniref:Uncharacterized protein n=1 Tax=Junco hyemalis TaxID=40217 RepID=A0A8C5J667_JUNHY
MHTDQLTLLSPCINNFARASLGNRLNLLPDGKGKDLPTQQPVTALPETELCSKSCEEAFPTSASVFSQDQKDRHPLQQLSHCSHCTLFSPSLTS